MSDKNALWNAGENRGCQQPEEPSTEGQKQLAWAGEVARIGVLGPDSNVQKFPLIKGGALSPA